MISYWKAKYFGLIGLVLLTPSIFGNISKTARYSTFSHLPNPDSFTTILISSLSNCGNLCKSITSCLLLNYRIRGHVCTLEHHIGEKDISIKEEKKDGFVTWRNELFDTLTDVSNRCPNCTKTRSCVVDLESYGCEPFACGKPHMYGTMAILGNINTLRGRFIYFCYNHTDGSTYSQNFQCSLDGTWLGQDDVCRYEDYELEREPFKLKIISRKVNKTQAMERCGYEGANLTNILTREKLLFFQGISNKLPGDFWVDLERVGDNYTVWTSSDGHVHEIDYRDECLFHCVYWDCNYTALWSEYTGVHKKEYCARSRESSNWRNNDIACWKPYYYICELSSN